LFAEQDPDSTASMKKRWRAFLAISLGFCVFAETKLSPTPGGTVTGTFKQQVSKTQQLNYLLFVPKEYSAAPGKPWPLVLFLHGAGERGSNVQEVAIHGPPKLVNAGKKFPFILVSPQCPSNESWSPEVLTALLDEIESQLNVDRHREYVTGLSMGGHGTWAMGVRYPKRFAAIAPVCGDGESIPALVDNKAIKSLGVWAFHGAKDDVISPDESQRMIDAFKQAGNTDNRLTVYPEADHDSWTQAYNTSELYTWLLRHRRP
jgi:predicted peptidase